MESSLPLRTVPLRKRSGIGAITLLLIVLVFQLTVLPDTLGIKVLGRVFNAIALASFLLGGIYALFSGRTAKIPRVYLISVLLVVVGFAINIARSLSPESVGAASALLPWLAAIAVPYMKSFSLERSWRLYYRFMLWGAVVSAIEYAAVFSGLLTPTAIDTDRGLFLKGVFSIFFGLSDGEVHYRMYGLFAEPGTYAMFLIPAIAYAWLHGKKWPAAFFLACFYLTDSLGGILGLFVMGVTYLFWRSRSRPVGLLVGVLLAMGAAYSASGSLRERYDQKNNSRVVREDNVTLFRDNFVSVVTANPLGLPLNGRTLSELDNATSNYIGSNFEIYTVFVKGGIIACVGYTALLLWMLVQNGWYLLAGDRDPERAAALISLPAMLLFTLQRETVLSSALFGFLYVQPLMSIFMARIAASGRRRAKRRQRHDALLPGQIAIMEGG